MPSSSAEPSGMIGAVGSEIERHTRVCHGSAAISAARCSAAAADEELQRALFEQVRQYPGQEQQVYDYFRKTPEAIQSLRAPIYEEKVVDHVLGQVKLVEEPVSKETLFADDEETGGAGKAADATASDDKAAKAE